MTKTEVKQQLFSFLEKSERDILSYLNNGEIAKFFAPSHIEESVWSYIRRPAKRLRPSVLLMSCGSVGGNIEKAIPAAAGVEVFHTWTLVHDDLIDNDNLRRGFPTVHNLIAHKSVSDMKLNNEKAIKYGESIAILTGDMQHGWATTLFIESSLKKGVNANVILNILNFLQSYVLANLIRGETLDVQYGLIKDLTSLKLTEAEVVDMLWLKTGILYEFAGMAGAMIGLETTDFEHPHVKAIKNFASNCGIAFQLQDDILGIIGNQEEIGKPVGSDIREGKKTIIVLEAMSKASLAEKQMIMKVLGNQNASIAEIQEVIELLRKLNGIKRCQDLANTFIDKAVPYLKNIPNSKYKELLLSWADFMINRNF
ncbi:MAG TPA: polyprenyl synthetase family protein [Pyrinomonadaceae bacterium]|jgi:geranylgeranyl diphosphate synthase type I